MKKNIWVNKYIIIIITGGVHFTVYASGNILYVFTYFSQEPYEVSTVIISILQMRQRKMK